MQEKLLKLQKNSYSPYSKYPVSAIAVMKDGTEFCGVNVENASYSATICAERVAIFSAIAKGYKKGDFKELHLMTNNKLGYPCFVCRQVISELFDEEAKIYCYGDDKVKIHPVKELCPYPFGEDDLKWNVEL